MAEINKLSVGQVLDKLRRNEASNSKTARADEKVYELDKEIRRLRAINRRLERDQRVGATMCDTPKVEAKRASTLKFVWITVGAAILIFVFAWWWLL